MIGPTGVIALALGSSWTLNNTINLMTLISNGLRLVGGDGPAQPAPRLGAVILALALGIAGSFWMIMHLAFKYGWDQSAQLLLRQISARCLRGGGGQPGSGRGLLDRVGVSSPGSDRHGADDMGAPALRLVAPASPRFPRGHGHAIFLAGMLVAWLIKTLVLRYGGAAVSAAPSPSSSASSRGTFSAPGPG